DQQTALFSNVRVNESIDPVKLQLRFPAGTNVTDMRSGKSYTVGDDEQPIGAMQPMGKARDLSGTHLLPTAMQPPNTPWFRIALWSLGGIGVAGLVVGL